MSEAEAVVTLTIVKRTQATRSVTLQISTQDGFAMCKLAPIAMKLNTLQPTTQFSALSNLLFSRS